MSGIGLSAASVLVLHVMKAAGTSLRWSLIDALGANAVFPNENDLRKLPRRWYPGPEDTLRAVRDDAIHHAPVLIGHHPYALAEALPKRPRVVLTLRHPIDRTLSMLAHRRRRFRASGRDVEQLTDVQLLGDPGFVDSQVRNYQTKILAFDEVQECAQHVQVALDIDDARFERALTRLDSVDAIVLTELYKEGLNNVANMLGVEGLPIRHENRGRSPNVQVTPSTPVLERIKELTELDHIVYRRAREIVERDATRASGTLGDLTR